MHQTAATTSFLRRATSAMLAPVGDWNAIVFSEVLSYLAVHEPTPRFGPFSPEGIVAVSRMNDGKAERSGARCAKSFDGSMAFSGSKRAHGPPTGSA